VYSVLPISSIMRRTLVQAPLPERGEGPAIARLLAVSMENLLQ
jgi:hypothetical protein